MADSTFYTADLCDAYPDLIRIAEPVFDSYGRRPVFGGKIRTLRVFEDNVLLKAALSEQGNGDVLVVDGGVRALASCPRKSTKRGLGDTGIPLFFAGVDFAPGEFVYTDADGIVVASENLLA